MRADPGESEQREQSGRSSPDEPGLRYGVPLDEIGKLGFQRVARMCLSRDSHYQGLELTVSFVEEVTNMESPKISESGNVGAFMTGALVS